MPEKALKNIAAKYHLTVDQATEILRLLDSGYSIPYVMRYHKDLAAGLQPEGFYELIEEKRQLEKLGARKRKILKKLQDRDILTEELEEKINRAADMRELIDYYVPFRPRKRSHSRQALAQGLRPLATQVLSQEAFISDMGAAAEPYVSPDEGLPDVEAVLEGVFHIVSDWVAEEKSHRDRQRRVFQQEAVLVAGRSGRSAPSRLLREFKPYFEFRQKAATVHPYHMLVIQRGKRLRVLQYHIEPPVEAMLRAAAELYLPGGAGDLDRVRAELSAILPDEPKGEALKALNGTEFLVACIQHSLDNILAEVATREMDRELCTAAEELALGIIRRNFQAMLAAQPLRKPMLGIHPGYRTGCNLAALDADGAVREATTVYPHLPQNDLEPAKETLCRLIEEHKVEVVAIGDGTGLEETEALMAGLIAEKFPELSYTVVSEVGVDAYATSRAARSEFPDTLPGERTAIAVCRRVQDPLSELSKISPRELCLQPYVDDVNDGALKNLLDRTIEACVCEVGVDANAAQYSLLRHVSGLGSERALELVEYRDSKGPLSSRQELREVPKIDQESFDRSAGFIRVKDSANPMDATRIHPRDYPVAEAICRQLEIAPPDLATEEGRARLKERAPELKLADLEKQFDVHYLLLKDIVSELAAPWPDPRSDGPAPILRQRRLTVEELQPGQWFTATVRNIVDFGVFVDIGVGEDGLVHISELSDRYVQSPYDVVCVGDRVRVKVVRVDPEKKRIALSMRSEDSRRERRGGQPRRRRPAERPREQAPPVRTDVPDAKPDSGVRTARSTLGSDSRRVRRAALADSLSKTQQQMLKKARPEPQQPDEEAQKGDEPKVPLSGLLDKLGFASIERRGEAND